MSLSRCTATRGETEADNAASEARTRVYFLIPRDDDNQVAAAVGSDIAVEAAAGKRQAVVRNPPVDNAVDTAEEVAARNSGVDNPADYTATTVRIPAAVVPAEVR